MKPYSIIRINRDIGAKVLIYSVTTKINPKDGWVTANKVPATILGLLEKRQCDVYTCNGGYNYARNNPFSAQAYLVKLDNITDIEGKKDIAVRPEYITFLERKTIVKQRKPIDLKKLVNMLDNKEKKELRKLL